MTGTRDGSGSARPRRFLASRGTSRVPAQKTERPNSPPHRASLAEVTAATRPFLPPLKALAAFEAAARHGSFVRAAAELGVTPSAVSYHLQQLEEVLGVPLFRRHAGRALLTAAGSTYAGEIGCAFATIAAATDLVAPQARRGRLTVAAGPSFAARWLQPRLPAFLRAHPDVQLRLSTLAGSETLEASRFDLAISYGRPTAADGRAERLRVEPLITERLRPLCAPSLAATAGLAKPEDLRRATLIHSVNALTWPEYFQHLHLGVTPSGELWLDRSSMAIEAAVDGLGVILESEILAGRELADGRLVAPFDAAAASVEATSYFLVWSSQSRSRQFAAFEAWLRAEVAASRPICGARDT